MPSAHARIAADQTPLVLLSPAPSRVVLAGLTLLLMHQLGFDITFEGSDSSKAVFITQSL